MLQAPDNVEPIKRDMEWFDGLPSKLRDLVNQYGPFAEAAIRLGYFDAVVVERACEIMTKKRSHVTRG